MRRPLRTLLRSLLLLTLAAVAARADDRTCAAADAAFRDGRFRDAAALYETAAREEPRDAYAWMLLGLSRLELGYPDEARAAVARAKELEGRTARVEFALGRLASAAGDDRASAESFRRVAELDPAYSPAWTQQNLGYALMRLGSHEEARKAFVTALARPGRHSRMYRNACQNELLAGDVAAALGFARAGAEVFPDDAWMFDQLGWVHTVAGDASAARAAYGRALLLHARSVPEAEPAVVPLPMRARVRVLQGPGGTHSHGSLRSRHAADLVVVDGAGRAVRGDGTRNEDHLSFDVPVLAVADGVVVAAADGVPDNEPGRRCLSRPSGNHVYLRHEDGRFSRYLHLRRGTVAVRAGERVRRGDELGRCGNSGWSTGPHLCFALTAAPPEEDVSVPFRFGACRVVVQGGAREVDVAAPEEGSVLEPALR